MIFVYENNKIKHIVTNNDVKGDPRRDMRLEVDGLIRKVGVVLKFTGNDNTHLNLQPLETIMGKV